MADYRREDIEGFRYTVVRRIGVLSRRTIQGEPWTLEANFISWNDKRPKLDIRSWDKKHERMTKGITLTLDEYKKLTELMAEGREKYDNRGNGNGAY